MKQTLWLLLLSLALTPFGSAHADIPPPPPEIRVEAALDAPVKSRVGADGTAAWYSGIYQYDGAGNIKAIGNETFVYDPVSRLRSGQVHTGTTVATQAYTYDSFGNMRSIVTSPALPTDVAAIAVNQATNRLTDAGYDAAGNMTSRAGYQYTWDELGELTSRVDPTAGLNERYAYSAAGERIAIFSLHSNSSIRTLRDGQNRVLTEFLVANQSTAPTLFLGDDFIYRGSQLLASTGPLNGIQHYHTDHLGTPRLLTNASGAKTAFHTYYPFGIEATSPSQNARRLKFTAHERDRDPGGNRHSDYMHARYSAAQLGRFMSVDPFLDQSVTITAPQMWNRYAYVTNNPMKFVDPTGLSLWSTLGKGTYYVLAYSKRHGEKLVAKILPGNKKTVMKQIRAGIEKGRSEGSKIAVVTPTVKQRDGIATSLSSNGSARGPERSGTTWPTHLNPESGPYKDVHVQTLSDTKKKGLGTDLLGLVAATTLTATSDPQASASEIISAALWDTAKAIDPLFVTDVIEYATGADEYNLRDDE